MERLDDSRCRTQFKNADHQSRPAPCVDCALFRLIARIFLDPLYPAASAASGKYVMVHYLQPSARVTYARTGGRGSNWLQVGGTSFCLVAFAESAPPEGNEYVSDRQISRSASKQTTELILDLL